MSERNTIVRSLNDLGLAAWFGGTLAGAVAVNGASRDVADPAERLRVANIAWGRWAPVNFAAIAVHLVGSTGLLVANRKRVVGQKGVGATSIAKTAFTGAALAATAFAGALGTKLRKHDVTPTEGATVPSESTPADAAGPQRQLRVLQWAIPALTAGIVVTNAIHGEQQRPGQQLPGILGKAGKLVGVA